MHLHEVGFGCSTPGTEALIGKGLIFMAPDGVVEITPEGKKELSHG